MADFDVVLETEVNNIDADISVTTNAFEVTVQTGGMGPQGVPGETVLNYAAGSDISGHKCVIMGTNSKAEYATCSDLFHKNRIIGITQNAAVSGDNLVVRKYGEITEPSWNWDTDKLIYLGVNGDLVQTPVEHPLSLFTIILGYPITTTKMFVNISQPIIITGA